MSENKEIWRGQAETQALMRELLRRRNVLQADLARLAATPTTTTDVLRVSAGKIQGFDEILRLITDDREPWEHE